MKLIVAIILVIISIGLCHGQSPIKVTINGNKLVLDKDQPLPLDGKLTFGFSDFDGKPISLANSAAENNIIIKDKFGSDKFRKRVDDKGNNYFEIKINSNSKIEMGANQMDLSANELFIKVDKLEWLKITFKKASDVVTYTPGSMVDDAIKLNEGGDNKLAASILKSYQIKTEAELNGNLFLLDAGISADFSGIQGASASPTKFFEAAGGLDVTTLADGLAKFIVKRTKQELTIAFFQQFKDNLSQYEDLKVLFPNTYNLLSAIGENIYNYSAYIANLREAFLGDLKILDESLPALIDNHMEDIFIKEGYFELGIAIKTGCHISSSLRHSMHPGDILETFPISYLENNVPPADQATIKKLKGAIQSLQLFSEALKSNNPNDNYWESVEKVRGIVNDKKALKIYLGLIVQLAKNKYSGVLFTDVKSIYNILNTSDAVTAFDKNYLPLRQYIITLASKTNEMNASLADLRKSNTDSAKVELIAKYFKATSQLLEYSVSIADLPFIKDNIPNASDIKGKSKKFFRVVEEVSDLTVSINRKRYAEVINHLVVIYDITINKPLLATTSITTKSLSRSDSKKLIQKIVDSKDEASVGELKKDFMKESSTGNDESNTKLALLAKYGAFMAALVSAKTSDEMADVIESAALPVGSASIKRNSNFNVALNAYSGIFIGNEVIRGYDRDKFLDNLKSYGIAAPVGVSISQGNQILPWPVSWVFKNRKPKGWSSSYFISIVDIGAIAAYRFTEDEAETIPTIQLKDIVSPGIFWSLGIPKSPISFNVGAQVGPNLRKVNDSMNDYSKASYVRYSLSICVDIPLLNFYNK